MKWYLDFGHGGKDSGAVSANIVNELNNKGMKIIK